MRERREVARRADAALRRDERHGVAVEQRLERVDDLRPNARIAAAEAEQLEQDHQPRDVARQRVAETGAVRQDQVGLELGQAVVGNARVGEQAEAGVDAIDRLARGDDALDRGGGGGDALHRRVVERAAAPEPELAELVERDVFRIELQQVSPSCSPAKAGVQSYSMNTARSAAWAPAFAGERSGIIGKSSPCSRAQSIAIS